MTTPRVFNLDGVNKVFQSDVPIKGIEYVVAYISPNGLSNSYSLVSQSLYQVINDAIVFDIAPIGMFLRLVVGTNTSELLNSPSNIATVAMNMSLIDSVSKNIDIIIASYNVIATAENIDRITIVGNNILSINTISSNILDLNTVSDSIDNVNLVGTNISKVTNIYDNITAIDSVYTNISKLVALYNELSKLVVVYNSILDVVNVSNNIEHVNTIASGANLDKIALVGNNIINVNLVGNNIDNVNLVANNMNSIVNKAKFKVKSVSSLPLDLKTLPKSPILTPLPDVVGFEINVGTNSVKNVSGRDLDIIGTMSIQISTTSTSGVVIYIYSETSIDNINWTMNAESLRKTKLDKDGTDYVTFPSMLISNKWINGTWIRFRFYKEGSGDATINTVSDTVGGNSITGSSFVWTLHEI